MSGQAWQIGGYSRNGEPGTIAAGLARRSTLLAYRANKRGRGDYPLRVAWFTACGSLWIETGPLKDTRRKPAKE